jgi:hypothetical protein
MEEETGSSMAISGGKRAKNDTRQERRSKREKWEEISKRGMKD